MKKPEQFNIFSNEDKGSYIFLRKIREAVVRPLIVYLAENKVRPNTLSYLGLAMIPPFIYFFSFNPWIAFIFLLLNLVLDSFDGSLARYLKIDSERGAFIDATFDYLSFNIIFLVFIYYQLVSPFWGAVFLISNMIMISLIVFCVLKKIKLFPTVRPRLFVYLVFFIWILTGYNYLDPFILLSTVYLIITNIFIYYKITCSLS